MLISSFEDFTIAQITQNRTLQLARKPASASLLKTL